MALWQSQGVRGGNVWLQGALGGVRAGGRCRHACACVGASWTVLGWVKRARGRMPWSTCKLQVRAYCTDWAMQGQTEQAEQSSAAQSERAVDS
jgi:hypothetical protein